MISTPRFRMVAGPNGSGKSTLLDLLTARFSLGYCLNPDALESGLQRRGILDFTPWGIRANKAQLRRFLAGHPLAPRSASAKITVRKNILRLSGERPGGYFVAMLADWMRRQWLSERRSFTFETVMSSRDKVELLEEARKAGYRTYLYFVCTESPALNHERVMARVRKGGHSVPEKTIESRYARSLSLLREAISRSSRAYVFDNSGRSHRLLAEFEENALIKTVDDPPTWFVNAVLG